MWIIVAVIVVGLVGGGVVMLLPKNSVAAVLEGKTSPDADQLLRTDLAELERELDRVNLDPFSDLVSALADRDPARARGVAQKLLRALRNDATRVTLFEPAFNELLGAVVTDKAKRDQLQSILTAAKKAAVTPA